MLPRVASLTILDMPKGAIMSTLNITISYSETTTSKVETSFDLTVPKSDWDDALSNHKTIKSAVDQLLNDGCRLKNQADNVIELVEHHECNVTTAPAPEEWEEFWDFIQRDFAADIDGFWCRHVEPAVESIIDLCDSAEVLDVDVDGLICQLTAADIKAARKTSGAWRVGEHDFTFYTVTPAH